MNNSYIRAVVMASLVLACKSPRPVVSYKPLVPVNAYKYNIDKKQVVDSGAVVSAHKDMYLDKEGNADVSKSQNGHLASGVPGAVAGAFTAHKYARLPFSVLI